jgi:hypothetical protein
MSDGMNQTYVLYLVKECNYDKNIVLFLGSADDSSKLYMNGLNHTLAHEANRTDLLKWLLLVETELSEQEKKDLEYAFMYNPEMGFSYAIKEMSLHVKKINKFC